MAEDYKNKEGQSDFAENSGDNSNENPIFRGGVNMSSSAESEDSEQAKSVSTEDAKTIEEWDKSKGKDKKIQNLISLSIILAGLLAGSLFVDVAQFLSQNGYSERALKNAEVFALGDKTWVAHKDEPVELQVLIPSEEEMKNCENCDPTEVITWLKRFMPTLVSKKVTTDSEKGKNLIEQYNIKAVPAFVFDEKVKNSDFYQDPQVQAMFEEKDGSFIMNSIAMGIPTGKYLEKPSIEDGDAVYGDVEADLKIVVFSDFQCPYSKNFYDNTKNVIEEYEDKIAFTYKDLPLSFHPQAQNAALAARCAQEQESYWEMADELYSNQETWGEEEGVKVFSSYAREVGLDMNEYNTCMEEQEYLDKIEQDAKLAGDYGISGTPSGFIGDEFMGGVLTEEEFKQQIENQLGE